MAGYFATGCRTNGQEGAAMLVIMLLMADCRTHGQLIGGFIRRVPFHWRRITKDKMGCAMGVPRLGQRAPADEGQNQGKERTIAAQQQPLPAWQPPG